MLLGAQTWHQRIANFLSLIKALWTLRLLRLQLWTINRQVKLSTRSALPSSTPFHRQYFITSIMRFKFASMSKCQLLPFSHFMERNKIMKPRRNVTGKLKFDLFQSYCQLFMGSSCTLRQIVFYCSKSTRLGLFVLLFYHIQTIINPMISLVRAIQ